MTTLIPVLAAIVGALLYGLADGKLSELGRLAFACGLLVALSQMAGHAVRLF